MIKQWDKIQKKQVNPMYLLLGEDTYLIEETIKKLINNILTEEEKELNISVYDLEVQNIEEAIDEAEILPFLGEKKIVIAKNPLFLTAQKGKIEHNIDALESYIKNIAPFTVFIVVAPYSKLDERKKITKLIKKHAEVVDTNQFQEDDKRIWIKQFFEQAQLEIDEDALDQLLFLTGGHLMAIQREMEKLRLFLDEGGVISKDVVMMLVPRTLEHNIFELIDKVVKKQASAALQIFFDLLKNNEEPIKILALLVSQFRLIYQVKELMKQGYGQNQVAGQLKVHPYRVKLAYQQGQTFKEQDLEKILYDLAEADYEMKTGKRDKQLILELFFTKLFKVA
ncbi:DNA polymerase III subunit delta [Bacillus carboniphilus]|uniref:DNA polymerase III subunit delta n=1 Tax=Bacillus carboniphilus TaxID=86663 RepID=A0ABY9JYZ1_9BACI|nr:DNA polymerase III subunit delta [Bacillus carboniphilus]WLR44003.1 DNA polymerase III subunit delta [Bacillus carboniphilus]